MKNNKISLRTWMVLKIIPAILLLGYYWMCIRVNRNTQSFMIIQNALACLAGGFLALQFLYGKKRDFVDEFAREILAKTDSICLKICYVLLILISFSSAIFLFSGVIVGYLVVGSILILTIVRAVVFYIFDSKGM